MEKNLCIPIVLDVFIIYLLKTNKGFPEKRSLDFRIGISFYTFRREQL